ncbi:hypothetical protein IQ260_20940 [Leptolyngbya cf. ectocarpi LEGE 11479]|uniref:SCP2 domain-containing protein n=1 Tax=Leptolyngbya cf. ectocarpi LEGE 11479 TaxID=1828722 RepID=A0A928ZX84_LEPEC|nr:hypothetical protein [Leptolyngbya ectocarpi]MBE9069117.1 hypothetical protein [Leptolyngbya cf. ectocarpi LEGE 11479]
MKPWQIAIDEKELRNNLDENQRKILDQGSKLSSAERIEGIKILLELKETYWKTVGEKNPFVIQFCITDEPSESWYVKVDKEGGLAAQGTYSSEKPPTVTWTSDFADLERTFQGIVPAKLDIVGDRNILKTFFAALYQSSPYSS